MIRSQPQLSDDTVAFLNSEVARLSNQMKVKVRDIKVVKSVYDETDWRKKGYIPVWAKLFVSLDPKEQTFAIASAIVSRADYGRQGKQLLTVCGICIALIFIGLFVARFFTGNSQLAVFISIAVIEQVIFWGAIIRLMRQSLKANFDAACALGGDREAGRTYFLKRNAVRNGDDALEALVNPKRYENWVTRICDQSEGSSGL